MGKSRVLRELETPALRPPGHARPSAPGAACPTAAASSSGRSARCCARSAESSTRDSAEEAWCKLRDYAFELFGGKDDGRWREEAERQTALIARLIGLEVPAELVPPGEDPERLRESFFSALRAGIEAMASRQPLVLAFEDIHWADDGMLDAIEHLAQWVRAPLMLVCLARDELLDRRPTLGRRARLGHPARARAADRAGDGVARRGAAARPARRVPAAVVERSGGNPLFAEEMARRIAEDGHVEAGRAARHRPGRAGGPPRRARARSSAASSSRPRSSAGPSGRARWHRWSAATSVEFERALISLQEKDILAPGADERA